MNSRLWAVRIHPLAENDRLRVRATLSEILAEMHHSYHSQYATEENMLDIHSVDPARLEAFAAKATSDLTAGYTGTMVNLGTKLGLYSDHRPNA